MAKKKSTSTAEAAPPPRPRGADVTNPQSAEFGRLGVMDIEGYFNARRIREGHRAGRRTFAEKRGATGRMTALQWDAVFEGY